MAKKALLKGPVLYEDGYWYINMYTCNRRCSDICEDNKVTPEVDKCCQNVLIMLDQESQDKVNFFDEVYFEICHTVDKVLNNHIGLYAKYIGHHKVGVPKQQ